MVFLRCGVASISCIQGRRTAQPHGEVCIFGYKYEANLILEAITSYDLWICKTFFKLLGSNNDINMLERYFIYMLGSYGTKSTCNRNNRSQELLTLR